MSIHEPLTFMPLDLDTFSGSERFMSGTRLGAAFSQGIRAYLRANYGTAIEHFKAALIAAYIEGEEHAQIAFRTDAEADRHAPAQVAVFDGRVGWLVPFDFIQRAVPAAVQVQVVAAHLPVLVDTQPAGDARIDGRNQFVAEDCTGAKRELFIVVFDRHEH